MAWNEPGNDNKDPWGKKQGDGPPDIDEAMRKMKDSFMRLFGNRGGGSEPTNTKPSMPTSGISLFVVIAVVIILIWAASGFFIVDPAERAVVLRFGKYEKTVDPGLHWIPRFIADEYTVNEQKVSTFSYDALMLTKDENIVSVSIAVQYRIGNARDYLFNVVNPAQSLRQATASALRQVIGNTTLDSVLTSGREQVRQSVQKQLLAILQRYSTGLVITDVAMQPVQAPDQVKDAFDDAIKAQEDEQRYINQAQAYASKVEPIAAGQAKRIMNEAQAYKQQIVLAAEANTARFLALLPEYLKAPQVTRERLYLDTMQSVMSRSSKVLVDVKGSNNLLYLPLDKILGKLAPEESVAKPDEDERKPISANTGDKSVNSSSRTNSYGVTSRSNSVRDEFLMRGGR